jgi:hypothetical protein
MPESDDKAKEALSDFGRFLMENLRDKAIDAFDRLAAGKIRAPKARALKLQQDLAGLGEAGVAVARRALVRCVDSAIHDFLFKLQERADFENEIRERRRGE